MILNGVGTGDRLIQEWERGWQYSDKLICPSCIGDDYLRDVVARELVDDEECSFCGAASAAAFDVFMEAFMVGVNHAFEQADDAGMPWEGGYVFTTYEHYELPEEFGWVAAPEHDGEVLEEIRDRLVEKTYASRWWAETEPDEAFSTAWQQFRDQIMHRTRFVFWARQGQEREDRYLGAGDVSVAKVLEAIGKLLVSFDLITTLPAGTVTYRARGHAEQEDSKSWGAAELGTNTPHNATNSSRMSPAGIPLFYGADDIETALAEVAHADPRSFFTVGKFVTTEPTTVIDLTDVPSVPSIFDPVLGGAQGQLRFLNELVDELRKLIDSTRGNLDYVPTQVFCEYFLHVFNPTLEIRIISPASDKQVADPTSETEIGGKIRGLMWKSVAAGAGGATCLALNVRQEDCVDVATETTGQLQLHLVPESVTVYRRRIDEFRQL